MSNLCQLRFHIRVNTNYKETVRIVGNIAELGSWDPYKGLELTTNPDKYPIWYSENPLWLPKGTRFEFKIVIFENYQLQRWESLPDNGNRKYRIRFYSVTLECIEADIGGREIIHKKFSSGNNLDQPKCIEVKKVNDKKFFNPFDLAGSDDSDPESDFSSSLFSSGSYQYEESPNTGKDVKRQLTRKTSFYSPAIYRNMNSIDDENPKQKKLNEIYQNMRSKKHNIMWHKSTKFQIHAPNYLVEYILPGSIEDFEQYMSILTFEIPFEIKTDALAFGNYGIPMKIIRTNINPIYDVLNNRLGANFRWVAYVSQKIMKDYERIMSRLLDDYHYIPNEINEEELKKMNRWNNIAFHRFNKDEIVEKVDDYNDYDSLIDQIKEITNEYIIKLSKNIIDQNIVVNDIRLIFAAQYINRINLTSSICFICNFPFPNCQDFRYMINGRIIIEALLFYNIIYFENYDDMTHFVEICISYYRIQPISKKYSILLQIFGRTIILNTKKMKKTQNIQNSKFSSQVQMHHQGHDIHKQDHHQFSAFRNTNEKNSGEQIIIVKKYFKSKNTSFTTIASNHPSSDLLNKAINKTNIMNTIENQANIEHLFDEILKDFRYSAKLYEYAFVISSITNNKEILMGLPKEMKKLHFREVCKEYDASFNRVFIFSFEGLIDKQEIKNSKNINENEENLRFVEQRIKDSINKELQLIIRKIGSNEENTIFIITKYSKFLINHCFDDSGKLSLLAENGYYYKDFIENQWLPIINNPVEWLSQVQNIMEKYLNQVQNAILEKYDSFIQFKIKGTHTIITKGYLDNLEEEIKSKFQDNQSLEIIKTRSKVIVRPFGLNKGTVSQILLQKVFQEKEKIDFLFIFGQSLDDEEMFAGARRSLRYCQEIFPEGVKPIFCILGERPSEADYFVENHESLTRILSQVMTDQVYY